MTWLEALLIGFVQDISEFFPISSTALMLIVQRLLHITIGEDFKLVFESLLHIASVLAVIVYFRQDLRQIFVDFIRYIWLKNHDARRNYRFTLFTTLISLCIASVLEFFLGEGLIAPATIGVSLIITGLLILMEHGLTGGTDLLCTLIGKMHSSSTLVKPSP